MIVTLRNVIKKTATIFLLCCLIPWLFSFLFLLGFGFLWISAAALFFHFDPLTIQAPHVAQLTFIGLVVSYYIFPIACYFFYVKVFRSKQSEAYALGWVIFPVFISLVLMFFIYCIYFVFNVPSLTKQRHIILILEKNIFHQTKVKLSDPVTRRSAEPLPGGNYTLSCSDCMVINKKLSCNCFTKNGKLKNTALDLTILNRLPQIQNCDGQLLLTSYCPANE